MEPSSGYVRASVTLVVGAAELSFDAVVPSAPVPQREMLPLLRALDDAIITTTANALEQEGTPVSCQKGCGACCRQLVPISEVEAHALSDLIAELPEARRSVVRSRFAAARQRLEQAGLLERLHEPDSWAPANFRRLGMDYLALGLACPFLEDESCSIHPDRPLTCREFLVTSPATCCSQPTPESVRVVSLPLRVITSVARCDTGPETPTFHLSVPLILAPAWAESHPDEPPRRTGPEWLRDALDRIRLGGCE